MNIKKAAEYHLHRMDIIISAAEIRWGIMMQLVNLAGGELAEKFERQWSALSAAILESRYADIVILSDGVCRGVWALERAAIAAGHVSQSLPPYVHERASIASVEVSVQEIKKLPAEFWDKGGDEIGF